MITIDLTILNTILLIGIIVYYFKKNFVVMDKQSWDILEQFVADHQQDEIHTGDEQAEELAGGSGFFKEYIEEEDEEE